MQNDFAARLDWCVNDFSGANHPPRPRIAGLLHRTAKPGERVPLDARACSDPDGDALALEWVHYGEAGTFRGAVSISDTAAREASFVVPEDARAGETIHVVLMVTDSGAPKLTRYQRMVVTVGGT